MQIIQNMSRYLELNHQNTLLLLWLASITINFSWLASITINFSNKISRIIFIESISETNYKLLSSPMCNASSLDTAPRTIEYLSAFNTMTRPSFSVRFLNCYLIVTIPEWTTIAMRVETARRTVSIVLGTYPCLSHNDNVDCGTNARRQPVWGLNSTLTSYDLRRYIALGELTDKDILLK